MARPIDYRLEWDISAKTLDLEARRVFAETLEGRNRARYLCKWDLRYLCKEVLGYKDWDVCHDDLYEWLETNKGSKRKLLLIPRGHLKSSIVTVGLSIQEILQDFNRRILIANAIWDNARGFTQQIADYFNKFSVLKDLFGDFRPHTRGEKGWTKDALTVAQRTIPLKEATVTSTGVERTQASQHYDKIVLDDVVARENITTKEQRNKIVDFYGDCLSLLEPGGEVLVIGTTWHEDDLYNLLRKDEAYVVYRRTALEPPNFIDGTPIFPKKFSKQTLIEIKDEFNKKGKMGQFYAQYFLDPYPDEDAEFKKEWFKYYDSLPRTDNDQIVPLYVSVCLDPSLGKAASDNAAISATAVDARGSIYVLQARGFKCHVDYIGQEVVKTLMFVKDMGLKTSVVGIEGFAFQAALETPIREAMRAAGFGNVSLEVLPRSTDESKDSRIMALIPFFAQGKIFIKQNMADFKDEMVRFKKNVRRRKDDILDSVAWQIGYWRRKPEEKQVSGNPAGSYGAILEEMKRGFHKSQTIRQEFSLH